MMRGASDLAEPAAGLPFVFVIGFNKTGTTALHEFFVRNGFPSIHWDKGRLARRMLLNCLDDRPILEGYDRAYRVFSDMAVQTSRIRFEANALFPVLRRDYPDAVFLLNTRPEADWLRSRAERVVPRFGVTELALEMGRLGTPSPEVALGHWAALRRAHHAAARERLGGSPRFHEIEIDDPDLPARVARAVGRPMDAAHWARVRTH